MKATSGVLATALVSSLFSGTHAGGAVLINEFQYDEIGTTDDREFIELFNAGPTQVDISGWLLTGNDAGGANDSFTVPGGTILSPGTFWVFGSAGVANVNQVITTQVEQDLESFELYDAGHNLQDAVVYESNKGGLNTIQGFSNIEAQVGPGIWANFQTNDSPGTPGVTLASIGRHIDGRDTNNNGRDFSLKPGTPGAPNNPGGLITRYTAPTVDAMADGEVVGGLAGSFVNARAFTPELVTPGLNPNAIPAPVGGQKAIIAWDNSGGGNATVAEAAFSNGGRFDIQVYLDTTNLPTSTNNVGTAFTGSEQTFFGIGGADALSNLADASGSVFGNGTLSANGSTGIAWYYEKVQNGISEKLYLIDANDGGQGNVNAPGYDWTVLAIVDLANSESAWHDLSLAILPDGSGSARFDDQTFSFSTIAGLVGEFYVSYRENTQDGTVLVPTYLRPPTFAAIPEPTVLGWLGVGGLAGCSSRRRRST